MGHTEKYLLRAVEPSTGRVIKEKWVYDKDTVECFAADWHLADKTRNASIYVDDELYFGVPCMHLSSVAP